MKKRKDFFTLMMIPHSGGRIRRIRTSKFAFSASIFGLIVVLAVLLFFIYDYRQMKQKVARLHMLEKVTQEQREKILSLNEKVKDFNQTMERLKDLENKLRSLAGIGGESTQIKVEALGKGGPEYYSLPEVAPEEGFTSSDLLGKIEENFASLETQAKEREKGFGQIEEVIRRKKDLFASTPNIFPVQGWITSGYGWRRNPFTGKKEFHKAIDISTPWGTPVRAAAKGQVVYAGWDDGYGLKIRIRDGYGYYTVYGHLSHILVKRGAWVEKGQIIGRVGSTGRSTGPHLHFEVWRNGKAVNPLNLMVEPLG